MMRSQKFCGIEIYFFENANLFLMLVLEIIGHFLATKFLKPKERSFLRIVHTETSSPVCSINSLHDVSGLALILRLII